jgi:hypothetical protein
MLTKFAYLAFGFVLGAALLLALTTAGDPTLSKTSRLNGLNGISTPTDFVMERFG